MVLAGGIFLSKKVLKKFKSSLFIYDKSRELSKLLLNAGLKKTYEIDTLKKDVFETMDVLLKSFVDISDDCGPKIKALRLKMTVIKNGLEQNTKIKKIIFFLGRIKTRLPELVIVNDGFVLAWTRLKKLLTYESELSYVSWSKKQLKKYQDYQFIGINESKSDKIELKKYASSKWNLFYRGVLTPGIRQLYFLEELSHIHLNDKG
jgi:hypothetical protein